MILIFFFSTRIPGQAERSTVYLGVWRNVNHVGFNVAEHVIRWPNICNERHRSTSRAIKPAYTANNFRLPLF